MNGKRNSSGGQVPEAPKIAIGYARVSKADKKQKGLSLDAQRRKIELQAELKGLDLRVVEQEIASAKRADNRKVLQRVLAAVQSGEVDAVIIYALDRLTRHIGDLQTIIALCERRGVQLISVSESLDTETAAGRLVVNILGVMAQWQREYIGERTAEILAHKSARGERVGGIPFGFDLDVDETRLVANRPEQVVVRLIRWWRHQGWSLRRIAGELDRRGVPTKKGGSGCQSKTTWCHSSVSRIVSRAAAQ